MNFVNWIKFSFERPVLEKAWYWSPEYDDLEYLEPSVAVDYLTQLFSYPNESLIGLSDEQVNQGLWYIISSASTACAYSLFSEDVPWEKREVCIDKIEVLYSNLFKLRCSESLSHCNNRSELKPLNSICYMFWDIIPWCSDKTDRKVYFAYLDVIEKILKIEHEACQESALHGLGHSVSDYPEKVEKLIESYLSSKTNISPRLKKYALNAKVGNIE